ncbi:uncharacterized protein LOC135483734 [Lineus longissimus]|uniref:uncharacterized protein LOC135483734 n=1 Tax=Lineus longissimus TaxID=88925 RepID=UPI002B4EDC84
MGTNMSTQDPNAGNANPDYLSAYNENIFDHQSFKAKTEELRKCNAKDMNPEGQSYGSFTVDPFVKGHYTGTHSEVSSGQLDDSVKQKSYAPPPRSCVPPAPPLPSDGILVKRQSSLSQNDKTKSDEGLPTLDDNWPAIIEGFEAVIKLIESTREESAFKNMLEQMDSKLNGPYNTFTHKDERKRMGDYLATKTDFAKVISQLYFHLMLSKKYVHYTKHSTDTPSDIALLILRNFMWNFTDMCKGLAKKFAETGIVESLLSDVEFMTDQVLQMAQMDPKLSRMANHPIFSAFGVLHNCVKAPNVKMKYSKHNAVDIIFPYFKCKNEAIKATAVMILSYIIDEENNDLLVADKEVFDFTILTLKKALSSPDKRADGFSSYELTEALTGMAKNDTNKCLIAELGGLKPLVRLLEIGDDDEKSAAAEAIWMLAFHDDNKDRMRDDPNIVPLLKGLKNSPNWRLRKRCEGALWEINVKRKDTTPVRVSSSDIVGGESTEKQPHIMLSYDWSHQDLVKKISDSLKASGYKTWIDVEQMEGSTLQAMAEAVEDSTIVLACVSEKYKDSPNCRSEAEYAYRMNKEIIPIMVQANYRPDGWLGLLIGTKLYYDFSGKHPFDKKLAELIRVLGPRGKPGALPAVPVVEKITAEEAQPVKSSPLTSHDSDISKWKPRDVMDWLNKNDVSFLPKLLTMHGKHLVFLKKLSIQAPEFFYNYLQSNLGLEDLDSLMKFSCAVEDLPCGS